MKDYQRNVAAIKEQGLLKLILLPVLIGFGIYLLPTLLQLVYNVFFPAPIDQVGSLPAALAMLTTVVVVLLLFNRIAKIFYEELGLIRRGWFKQFLIGEFGGGLILTFVVLIIWLLGGVLLQLNPHESDLTVLLVGLVFFIFQGTWEEIIYRVYLMPRFSKMIGDTFSIVITSALFTLGHALNPGLEFLPILNLFIGSLVFSMVYYYTGSLLIVGVGHGLWNYCQGFVFGAEVSGNTIKDSIMLSKTVPGMELISGGKFGYEGGLITSLTGIALVLLFLFFVKKRKAEKL